MKRAALCLPLVLLVYGARAQPEPFTCPARLAAVLGIEAPPQLQIESPARIELAFAAVVLLNEPTVTFTLCEYSDGARAHSFRVRGFGRCAPQSATRFRLAAAGARRDARRCSSSAAECALACERLP